MSSSTNANTILESFLEICSTINELSAYFPTLGIHISRLSFSRWHTTHTRGQRQLQLRFYSFFHRVTLARPFSKRTNYSFLFLKTIVEKGEIIFPDCTIKRVCTLHDLYALQIDPPRVLISPRAARYFESPPAKSDVWDLDASRISPRGTKFAGTSLGISKTFGVASRTRQLRSSREFKTHQASGILISQTETRESFKVLVKVRSRMRQVYEITRGSSRTFKGIFSVSFFF